MSVRYRAAVLGDPIEHSRSPLIHNAGYAAAGLSEWEYGRFQCDAESLPALVGTCDESYRGFSVTMPGKFAALNFATESTPRARAIGSANTLVRTDSGWRADNTDCDGVTGALAELGITKLSNGRAVLVGAGGTARPALWALAQVGVTHLTVVARSERAYALEPLAAQLGVEFVWVEFTVPNLADIAGAADVLVSTVPAAALEGVTNQLARAPKVLDVIYDPRPTALVAAALANGHSAVDGLSMLLHQALGQFEQFTGVSAPADAMRSALYADVDGAN
ncbi:shikimate dehydrogenase [Corynebacterium sp. H113]|uniref:shikimate dehydrogenase n=1 Tax=Corynebacterium sp. H113 TaxID=3133419 RepID=UPI0030AEC080